MAIFFARLFSRDYITYVVDVVLCITTLLLAYLMMPKLTPFCRPFIATDPTISRAYNSDTVTVAVLTVLCVPVTMACLVVVYKFQFRSAAIYIAWLSLLEALSLAAIITESLKIFIGRYRPDWLERLTTLGIPALMDFRWLCGQNSNSTLHEGRVSFPSGHSSAIFAACTLISLHMAGVLRLFRPYQGSYWKLVLVLAPELLAFWVAGTRTRDNRHNFDDVLTGALIGAFSAALAYGVNFASLWGERCGRPYTRRQLLWFDLSRSGSATTTVKDPQPSEAVVVDLLGNDHQTQGFEGLPNAAATATATATAAATPTPSPDSQEYVLTTATTTAQMPKLFVA